MIRIGTAGIPSEVKTSQEAIKWLRAHDLDAMEVEFVRGVKMSYDTAKKLGELARENDISLSVHAPYYINLCNPEKRDASIKRIVDSAKRAEFFNGIVVVHPGYYGKNTLEECKQFIVEACEEIRKKTSAEIGLETMGRTSQFGDLDQILSIYKKTKCAPVVDFAHIYARNFGKINYGEILDKMSQFKHIHSHFSGIRYGNHGEINHEPIGNPDFTELAKLLIKRKVDITMICESPLLEKDAIKMKNILEDLKRNR